MNSELILGIVRTVGTNAEPTIDFIKNALGQFEYTIKDIKVAEYILNNFSETAYRNYQNRYNQIDAFMNIGNELRRRVSPAIVMEGVAAYIYSTIRRESPEPSGRVACIVDSIKNPEEVKYLRELYGDGFHLIGITASYESRLSYLTQKQMSEDQARYLIARDEDEADDYGQHTRDVFQDADYFFNADEDRKVLEASVNRLFDLLFGNPFVTPTFDEYAMFRAYVASLRSADLSRQVGAVVTRSDEILAEGANDCPKAGGGIYWQSYMSESKSFTDVTGGRDWTRGYDSNRKQQEKLSLEILNVLGVESTNENISNIRKAGVGQITEYGRIVHAEMEALMMCARNGIPTRGCSMYVTTFPCHNCAKHIVDAGVENVTYIEPYPKSHALDFYTNEINHVVEMDSGGDPEKVNFRLFFGVGPHRFIDLFAMNSVRWSDKVRKNRSTGEALEWDKAKATLRNPIKQFAYFEAEQKAYSDFFDAIEGWSRDGQ